MELKLLVVLGVSPANLVLIVPFMELKLINFSFFSINRISLNRTFYGIETVAERTGVGEGVFVLIVPFMELKQKPLYTLITQIMS